MGLMDSLFGLGGETTTATRMDTLTESQKQLLDQLIGSTSSGLGNSTPAAPFKTYSDINGIEQQYLDLATGKDTTSPAGQALLNVLSGKPAYDINPEATKSYFENSIRDPELRQFQQYTLPGLTESFSGPSFWSSNRADQTTKAWMDLNNNLNSQWGELQYNDELARRTALENAMGRQATGAQNAVTNVGTAGAYARTVDQEKIASEMARWLSGEEMNGRSISAYNPNMQVAMSLLGVQPYTYGTNSERTGTGIISGLIRGLLGGTSQ